MSQDTFRDIVRIVQAALEKRDIQFRRAIPIEKRVAIALWRLSTGNLFRTVAKTFVVGKSTAVDLEAEEKQRKLLNSSSFFANAEYLKCLET